MRKANLGNTFLNANVGALVPFHVSVRYRKRRVFSQWVTGVAQKPDLANQIKALEVYCNQHMLKVDEWMQDIGSGLNYKRKQFNRLMEMVELGQVRRIVNAHRDRLVRFGYGYFEAFCERHNTELVVIDAETLSSEQELVQDLVAILTMFSARLHGLRSYKKAIRDAALQKDQAQRD